MVFDDVESFRLSRLRIFPFKLKACVVNGKTPSLMVLRYYDSPQRRVNKEQSLHLNTVGILMHADADFLHLCILKKQIKCWNLIVCYTLLLNIVIQL